ncbi:MAG: hypothetical protein AAFN10_13655 [Bacteroidota bacterium]
MKTKNILLLLVACCIMSSACEKNKLRQINNCCEESGLRLESGTRYVHINSAFTPNGDGFNDLMAVFTNASPAISSYRLVIRGLGLTLFETTDINNYWTGAINVGSEDPVQGDALPVVRAGEYKFSVEVEFTDGTLLEGESNICVYQTCEVGGSDLLLPDNCTFPDQFNVAEGTNTFATREVDCN